MLARLIRGRVAFNHDRADVRVLLLDFRSVRRPEGDVVFGERIVAPQAIGDDGRPLQVLTFEDEALHGNCIEPGRVVEDAVPPADESLQLGHRPGPLDVLPG